MKNDKEKRKLIFVIVVVLVIINLIVFGILFLNLSEYIWPDTKKTSQNPGDNLYVVSADGTVSIDGVVYQRMNDGNFMVVSSDKSITAIDVREKINESDTVYVTEIGDNAFSQCESLNQITIPQTIIRIGKSAFNNCTKLTTISIPYNVKEIGEGAFTGCKSLTSIKVHLSNENYSHQNGVLYDKEGKKLYVYPYNKTDEAYMLPDTLESIEFEAFRGFEKLQSVGLPENLKNISQSAFEDCTNLKSIMIFKNVENIGENAFKNCSSDLTIYGEKDSYAEKYANENNITFKLLNEWNVPTIPVSGEQETNIIGENNTNTENNENTENNNTVNNIENNNSITNETEGNNIVNTNSTIDIEL